MPARKNTREDSQNSGNKIESNNLGFWAIARIKLGFAVTNVLSVWCI